RDSSRTNKKKHRVEKFSLDNSQPHPKPIKQLEFGNKFAFPITKLPATVSSPDPIVALGTKISLPAVEPCTPVRDVSMTLTDAISLDFCPDTVASAVCENSSPPELGAPLPPSRFRPGQPFTAVYATTPDSTHTHRIPMGPRRNCILKSAADEKHFLDIPIDFRRQVRLTRFESEERHLLDTAESDLDRDFLTNSFDALLKRDGNGLIAIALQYMASKGETPAYTAVAPTKGATILPVKITVDAPTEGAAKKKAARKQKKARHKARKEAPEDMDVDMTADSPGPEPQAAATTSPEAATTTTSTPAAATGRAGKAAVPTSQPAAAKAAKPSSSQRTAAVPAAAKTPAKKSWAGVARSAITTFAATTSEAAWTIVTGKKSTATVIADDDKILVLKGAKKLPDPRLLRNTINGSGFMHVVAARLSAKGNAVLTCASPESHAARVAAATEADGLEVRGH
ncbi:hypothetical protein SEPCBS57363_006802, partial [Sporothrix epigloea]